MTTKKIFAILACAAPLTLTGCGATITNAKILALDEANIAVTVNKDFSTTVINTHLGTRVKPCIVDLQKEKRSVEGAIEECYPEGHDPNGEILSSTKIIVRKGSICATIISGSRLYVLCQPPHNLGF